MPMTAEKVEAILQKLGQSAVFAVTTGGTFDHASRTVTGGSTANHSQQIVSPYNNSNEYDENDLVKSTKAKTMISSVGLTFTPVLGIALSFAGVLWEVVGIEPIYTTSTIPIGYMMDIVTREGT